MARKRSSWGWGEKKELARLAEVSVGQLSRFLHRRCRASARIADRLAVAASVMGLRVDREDFMNSHNTRSPLFEPKGKY